MEDYEKDEPAEFPIHLWDVRPVAEALGVDMGKWKLPILWLLAQETRQFAGFRRLLPDIASRVLSKELLQLEALHLVVRRVRKKRPLGVDYLLTDRGESYRRTLETLAAWGRLQRVAAQEERERVTAQEVRKEAPSVVIRTRMAPMKAVVVEERRRGSKDA